MPVDDKNDPLLAALGGVVVACAMFFFGVLVGHGTTREEEREAAVKAGVAEWVRLPNGELEFRYLECE